MHHGRHPWDGESGGNTGPRFVAVARLRRQFSVRFGVRFGATVAITPPIIIIPAEAVARWAEIPAAQPAP